MGFAGISAWKLGIVVLLLLVLFGSKRLRGLGSEVGMAIKGFRQSMAGEVEAPRLGDEAGGKRQVDS